MLGGFLRPPRHARRRRGRLRLVVAGVVVVALVAGVASRLVTMGDPPLRVTRLVPASVAFPGAAPRLAWPATGEAAMAVAGVGTIGTAGGDGAVPIASLAKVMTAYLVLRDHPLANGSGGFSLTMSAADAAEQAAAAGSQSTLRVTAGEVLDERQLLEALLIPSANNIADILAAYDAGSTAAFVAKMNEAARMLGMDRTTYADASGLDPTTVSNATDQLRLAQVAMADPTFAQIVDMPSATFPGVGTLRNFNTLAGSAGFVGVKSGSDSAAGGCLVSANRQVIDGVPVTFYGVVLGQERGQSNTLALVGAAEQATKALVLSAIAAVSVRTILAPGTPVLQLANADGRRVRAVTTRPIVALGWGALTFPLRLQSSGDSRRRVRAGQVLGSVTIGTSSSPVASGATVGGPSLGWRLSHFF